MLMHPPEEVIYYILTFLMR